MEIDKKDLMRFDDNTYFLSKNKCYLTFDPQERVFEIRHRVDDRVAKEVISEKQFYNMGRKELQEIVDKLNGKVQVEEKDPRIKELEKESENKSELGLALYIALAKQLEKHGMIDNLPSAIDQLVGKNCGKYADTYNEYLNLKERVKVLEKEVKKLKQENKKLTTKNTRKNRQLEESTNAWLSALTRKTDAQKEIITYKRAVELAYYHSDEFAIIEDVLKRAREEINSKEGC